MNWRHLAGMAGAVGMAGVLACQSPGDENTTPESLSRPAATVAELHGHGHGTMEGELSRRDRFRLRRQTDQFHSIRQAERAGYAAFGGCFDNPGVGGMGFHWANQALIADSTINASTPELMVYRPLPNGGKQLAAVEYIVFVDEWHAKGHVDPPSLYGQTFHINPTLLAKPFYVLHVWVWYPNPAGTFMDWNPNVSCS